MGHQYCRYCQFMVCGDANYCEVKKRTFTTQYIKTPNNCKYFILNPIDALGENKYGYRPREKKTEEKDNNQMSMF